jgi:hypothetical protein
VDKIALSEALRKHQLLVEYQFILPTGMDEQHEEETPDGDGSTDPNAGGMNPEGPDSTQDTSGDPNTQPPTGNPSADMNTDPNVAPLDQPGGEAGETDPNMTGTDIPTDDGTTQTPMGDTGDPSMMGADAGAGDVEIDITDLVNSTKDTNDKLDGTNQFLNTILKKFDELDGKFAMVDQIVNKIDGMEKEVEQRLPTPVEKLELRSMDSYPYNLKLSDFWDQKNRELGIDTNQIQQSPEFSLTQGDVTSDYDPMSIKASFNVEDDELDTPQM